MDVPAVVTRAKMKRGTGCCDRIRIQRVIQCQRLQPSWRLWNQKMMAS